MRNIKLQIKSIFWRGLKAFVPLVVTVTITIGILLSLEAFFGELFRLFLAKYYFKGLGLIFGIIFIFTLGLLLNAYFIRKIYALADKLAKRIPLFKTLYNAMNDVMDFFDKGDGSVQQTVIIDSPIGSMIGFITRASLQEAMPIANVEQSVLVYVPLSYTIGGITLLIPLKDITAVDWPVDEAMSFMLTAGMTGQKDKEILR